MFYFYFVTFFSTSFLLQFHIVAVTCLFCVFVFLLLFSLVYVLCILYSCVWGVCVCKDLLLKDEECERLSKVRDQLGQELEELTASLFQVGSSFVPPPVSSSL